MALKLKADPTFKATVKIPVPGGESQPVEFTCRHRTAKELSGFQDSLAGKTNAEAIELMVTGWNLDDAFSRENIDLLLDNYHGAARAISDAYMRELLVVRLGN